MTIEADTVAARPVLAGRSAPALELALVGGGTFRLADQRRATFTMLAFTRGLHCPVCQAQLREVDRRFDALAGRGIEVVSISGESEPRATRMRDEWGRAPPPARVRPEREADARVGPVRLARDE